VFRARTRVVPCLAGTVAVAAAGFASATPAAAHSLGSRTLQRGAKGADVSALQADLSQAGFVTTASGRFTAKTAAEVKRFQRFYQLKATGVADAHTIAVVRRVDGLDADATDSTSGGSGLTGGQKVKVKVKHVKAKRGVTNDPTKLLASNPVLAPVQRNGGSEHLGNRVVKPGMHGHDIRVLQAYLTVDGYPTTVDGDYGPSTESSVVSWQSANDVADNGVFTYADSRMLREDVAKVESSPKSVTDPTTTTPTTTPGATATIDSDGNATAPAGAPAVVQEMIAAANSIDTKPYIYAGGHATWNAPGYDCSGSVSFVLHAAGLLSSSEDSTGLESFGSPGKGQWVTIYANAGHTWIVIAGLAFDTAHWGPTTPAGTGPRWLIKADATANLDDGTGGYTVRHPDGL
jgi:peptidoglycan hydrolase-like protein with peptidoglycan-binding domain